MSYTSKDLFQDWYSSGIKREAQAEELGFRKTSIAKILETEDTNYWFDLLDIFLGIGQHNKETYEAFVAVFKEDDENFPLENLNIVRVLCGCAVMQRVEVNDSRLCDALALALISSVFLNRITELPLQQVLPQAKSFWRTECESVRSFKQPKIKPDEAQTEATPKEIYANFEKINRNYTVLAEETNILWWVIGSYSNLLEKPFNEIGFPAISILAPKELIELTKILPGIGRVDNIFNKIFQSTIDTIPSELTFLDYIQSLSTEASLLESFNSEIDDLIDYCPIIFAISCFKDHGKDTWVSVFSKRGIIKEDARISPRIFTKQLYNELLLVKAYDAI